MYLEGKKRKRKRKKKEKRRFLPKVAPLFLSDPGGDSFPPPEITNSSENLPSISNGSLLLVKVHLWLSG
jgi:hypothetical protein